MLLKQVHKDKMCICESKSHAGTDQNGLKLIFGAFPLVHEHLLSDVFSVLEAVQSIVGIAVQP